VTRFELAPLSEQQRCGAFFKMVTLNYGNGDDGESQEADNQQFHRTNAFNNLWTLFATYFVRNVG
jgi:hypothetical protein